MTIDEALSIIEERIHVTEYVGSSYVDCVDIEALRIAIKALKQEKCEQDKKNCNNCRHDNKSYLDEPCNTCFYIEGETAIPTAWEAIEQPERKKMSNKEWIDFLAEQFTVSRTSAREMLHGLMVCKAEDNFKKQFSGGKNEQT